MGFIGFFYFMKFIDFLNLWNLDLFGNFRSFRFQWNWSLSPLIPMLLIPSSLHFLTSHDLVTLRTKLSPLSFDFSFISQPKYQISTIPKMLLEFPHNIQSIPPVVRTRPLDIQIVNLIYHNSFIQNMDIVKKKWLISNSK